MEKLINTITRKYPKTAPFIYWSLAYLAIALTCTVVVFAFGPKAKTMETMIEAWTLASSTGFGLAIVIMILGWLSWALIQSGKICRKEKL